MRLFYPGASLCQAPPSLEFALGQDPSYQPLAVSYSYQLSAIRRQSNIGTSRDRQGAVAAGRALRWGQASWMSFRCLNAEAEGFIIGTSLPTGKTICALCWWRRAIR